MAEKIVISWPEGQVSGRLTGSGSNGILLAHGAGTNQDHPFMVALRDGLAEAGHTTMTFNYPYTERGSTRPDRTEKLVGAHRAAADFLAARVEALFLAGRSMGGRMATYLVAEGYRAAGVVLYAYPLHPAGKEENLRVAHFHDVTVPLLFFQGTRDALSRTELFDRHIRPLPNVTVEILEGASHSFRGGGWTETAMLERLVKGTSAWIESVSSGRSQGTGP
ncbi:MAG: alpha/beta hydrolase family protein [Acidimicrobiia bacterium]